MILAHLDFNIPLQSSQERGLLVPSSINPDWRTCDFNAHEVSGNQKCPEKMQNATRLQDQSSCLLWYLKHLAKYAKKSKIYNLTKGYKRIQKACQAKPSQIKIVWMRTVLTAKQDAGSSSNLLICVLRINRLSAIYSSVCLPIFCAMPTHWMNQCNHAWNELLSGTPRLAHVSLQVAL